MPGQWLRAVVATIRRITIEPTRRISNLQAHVRFLNPWIAQLLTPDTVQLFRFIPMI
jgi:hypothetical protein